MELMDLHGRGNRIDIVGGLEWLGMRISGGGRGSFGREWRERMQREISGIWGWAVLKPSASETPWNL